MKIYKYLLAGTLFSMMTLHAQANGPWPTATEDTVTLTSNQRVYLPVLDNDIGNELTIFDVNTTTVELGRVELDATSKAVYYQSASNFVGNDAFWYAFTDNLGRTNSAKVSIKVIEPVIIEPEEPVTPPVEDDYQGWPAANLDIVSTTKNTSLTIPVLANDVGLELALFDVNAGTVAGGRAFIQGDSVVYTPYADFTGEDSFWYAFSDARGRTNSTQVKVTVTPEDTGEPTEPAAFSLVTMHDDLLKRRSHIYGESGGTMPVWVASSASQGDSQLQVSVNPGFKDGQLITYRGADGDYYTTTVANTDGVTINLNAPLESAVNSGDHLWNFYHDGAHPNTYGFKALADFAIRQYDASTLNSGKHVLLGDSWFSTEGFSQRLAEKLSAAQIVNKGIGGNTSAEMLARFDQDVASQSPQVVWLIAGTNDYYQGVSLQTYINNMRELIARINALGAKAMVIDTSVAPLMSGSDELTQVSHEYAAALADLLSE